MEHPRSARPPESIQPGLPYRNPSACGSLKRVYAVPTLLNHRFSWVIVYQQHRCNTIDNFHKILTGLSRPKQRSVPISELLFVFPPLEAGETRK